MHARLLAYVDDEDLLMEVKARPHVVNVLLSGSRGRRENHEAWLSNCFHCVLFTVNSGFFCCQ